jgi:hypothetical protein
MTPMNDDEGPQEPAPEPPAPEPTPTPPEPGPVPDNDPGPLASETHNRGLDPGTLRTATFERSRDLDKPGE